MDFNTYQREAFKTAIYPSAGKGNLMYPMLGLCGEVGELINKAKKIHRDDTIPPADTIAAEVMDILWYVAALCTECQVPLAKVAKIEDEDRKPLDMREYQNQRELHFNRGPKNSRHIEYIVLHLYMSVGRLVDAVYRSEWGDGKPVVDLGEVPNIVSLLVSVILFFDLDLNDIAAANLAKLADRQARGVLGGSGDER